MRFSVFTAFMFIAPALADNFVVNSSYKLYQPQSETIRAFIEPGTLLAVVPIDRSQSYRGRVRVITPSGLIGEISRKGYDHYAKISEPIAYLKRPLTIKSEQFETGDKFLVSITDDDDEMNYKVHYPSPYLSLTQNRYFVKDKSKNMSDSDFSHYFRLVNPGVPPTSFPSWNRLGTVRDTWGCTKEKKEVTVVGAGAKAEGSFNLNFWRFFSAGTSAWVEGQKTATYTTNLHDEVNEHSVTYWQLSEPSSNEEPILRIALEKLSPCDKTKSNHYSYILNFPSETLIEPIVINRHWAEGKQISSSSSSSPIELSSLEDYRILKLAMQDFPMPQGFSRENYINEALLGYIMMMTASVSMEYQAN
ncbi:hypothetical protein OPW19_18910 [Vibrio europaeus]|uniref:hypothetical protein n=1 Tax=Vibrio europaeus TaxID=300876 RepID=UPI00233E8341|nr:hypothetical protein [Vibrio europaeus]MDC5821884.1 hypothetical protein [Vibrio europaeus]